MNEEEFSSLVLLCAGEVFDDREKTYLTPTRLVKLIVCVAEDLGFDITRGWYKYGKYSPTAYAVVRKYEPPFLEPYLSYVEIPNEGELLSKYYDLIGMIRESIRKLKRYFITTNYEFKNWIYRELAPTKYRGLYQVHQRFEENFDRLLKNLEVGSDCNLAIEEMYNIIGEYYNNITHIDDEEIVGIFCDYMDLLEMLLLKIQKTKKVNEAMLLLLKKLRELYCNEEDLWKLLVPYLDTLEGANAEQEKEKYASKIQFLKAFLNEEIQTIKQTADRYGLLPTLEEVREEIKSRFKKLPDSKKIELEKIY